MHGWYKKSPVGAAGGDARWDKRDTKNSDAFPRGDYATFLLVTFNHWQATATRPAVTRAGLRACPDSESDAHAGGTPRPRLCRSAVWHRTITNTGDERPGAGALMGVRRSEIPGLRWDDFDELAGTLMSGGKCSA